jgi:hypothetical protein
VQFGRPAHRLRAVFRLADHGRLRAAVQQHPETDALQRLVVDDQHRGHGRS